MPPFEHSFELLDASGSPASPAVHPHFVKLKGPVQMRRQEGQILARGGVDGVGARRIGKRGKPFTLVSEIDATSLAVAADIYGLTYRNMPYAGLVTLIQSDLDWGNYLITDVEQISCQACGKYVGGYSPDDVSKLGLPSGYSITEAPSAALLTCRWTLIG